MAAGRVAPGCGCWAAAAPPSEPPLPPLLPPAARGAQAPMVATSPAAPARAPEALRNPRRSVRPVELVITFDTSLRWVDPVARCAPGNREVQICRAGKDCDPRPGDQTYDVR